MTLKNEFLTAHSIYGGIGMNEKQAIQCVRIADKYAIDFSIWCFKYDRIYPKHNHDTTQLLEMFKKRKVSLANTTVADNVKALAMLGIEEQKLNNPQKHHRSTMLNISTSAHILQNPCYMLCFLLGV